VKLGPARSFGRDALRRVLARNESIVLQILRDDELEFQSTNDINQPLLFQPFRGIKASLK
jgi:hypothetical protein